MWVQSLLVFDVALLSAQLYACDSFLPAIGERISVILYILHTLRGGFWSLWTLKYSGDERCVCVCDVLKFLCANNSVLAESIFDQGRATVYAAEGSRVVTQTRAPALDE